MTVAFALLRRDLGLAFGGMAVGYLALTALYTLWLKHQVLLDVLGLHPTSAEYYPLGAQGPGGSLVTTGRGRSSVPVRSASCPSC